MRGTLKPKTPAAILNEEQTKAFLAKKLNAVQEAINRIENRKKLRQELNDDVSQQLLNSKIE